MATCMGPTLPVPAARLATVSPLILIPNGPACVLHFPPLASGRSIFPLASGRLLRRFLPSSLLRRSSVQAASAPFGSRPRPPSLLAPSSLVSPVGVGGLWLAGEPPTLYAVSDTRHRVFRPS